MPRGRDRQAGGDRLSRQRAETQVSGDLIQPRGSPASEASRPVSGTFASIHGASPAGLRVGRAEDNDIVVEDLLVSRHHAELRETEDGSYELTDLGSANGTFVNDRRVEGEVRVCDGDTLRVGTLAFTFRINTNADEVLPVQVVLPGDVWWLMEEPADSPALRVLETQRVDVRGLDLDAEPGRPAALSAGEFLRDHLRLRKH
jgi:predicted component of type VI protein secretion system